MDATTLHDLQVTVRKLADTLSRAQYGESRGGIVPPSAMASLVSDVGDAHATMTALQWTGSSAGVPVRSLSANGAR